MPIEQSAGGVVITGESIQHYRLLIMIQGLLQVRVGLVTLCLRACMGLRVTKQRSWLRQKKS